MSRRSKRFENRQKKRFEKKEKLKKYDDFEQLASLPALYKAANNAASGVDWKASVQRYKINILFRIYDAHKNLHKLKDMRKGFIEFDLTERGKTRHIKSVHFAERVIQKTLCTNALYPIMTNDLIYDNCASQKGKGTQFATDRVAKFLSEYYRKYKTSEGYALVIDFKSYFENILHEPLKEMFRKKFTDSKIIKYADDFVDAFGQRGLGLGSETSQIAAIAYRNELDHLIKEKFKCEFYNCYMDDSVIIHQSKEELFRILKELEETLKKYGITLNTKKTTVRKLKHGFTYLKTRFKLTETGKVVKRPCRVSITAERRKLKKQAKLVEQGVLTIEAVDTSFNSWLGSMKHRHSKRTVRRMLKLYDKLFGKYKNKEKKHGKENTSKTICNREETSKNV